MRYPYHPDTVLTASYFETLARDLLVEISIHGVESYNFHSGTIRQTLLQADVDQKSIKAVTDSNRRTSYDDYTLAHLYTVPADELEAVVNDLFS